MVTTTPSSRLHGSWHSSAAHVKRAHADVHAVYMIGEDGLEEELEMVGLRVVKEGARPAPGMTEDEFRESAQDPEVRCDAVVLWCFLLLLPRLFART